MQPVIQEDKKSTLLNQLEEVTDKVSELQIFTEELLMPLHKKQEVAEYFTKLHLELHKLNEEIYFT